MPVRTTASPPLITWGDGPTRLVLRHGPDTPVMAQVWRSDSEHPVDAQPLVEVIAVGHGHASANLRNTATAIGARLRFVNHRVETVQGLTTVLVTQVDEVTGLEAVTALRGRAGGSAVQATTTLRNTGDSSVHLQAVSSLMLADPTGVPAIDSVSSLEGTNEWLGEWRWAAQALRGGDDAAGLPVLGLASHQRQDARSARVVVSHGTWSSGERAPVGVVSGPSGSLAWQVEHPGPWRMELGVRLDADDVDRLVLGILGATDADHSWVRTLAPGEEFASIPVSVAWSSGDWQETIAELTRHRRAIRTPERAATVVVFNDYMNTLMGDPTTAKLLPLIGAAGKAGADYFCIDAGWYADEGDWWDAIGEWEPSAKRFPDGGLAVPIGAIRAAGMIPGLWLEPEVVGVRSPMAHRLPDEAFLQRHGMRVVEHDRYLLDMRHPAAREHLDATVDRLVEEFGLGFFKLDYNVTPGLGTDLNADSPGDGLLEHTRAYLRWLDGVLERHPHLVIENCASGAQRADYGLLSRLEMQSTTDQQEALRYPAIAAGALVAMLPEQAGNWAYPQPSMTDEEIAFTMVTGLSGRIYLSGHLDQMSDEQLALVREGVAVAKTLDDGALATSPVWPAGLPGTGSPWVLAGRATADETLLAVWFLGGQQREISVPMRGGALQTVYPTSLAPAFDARLADGRLHLTALGEEPVARLIRIHHDDAA
ncbi:glycoside hydrolase clan GH-D [Xylanimonas cellulosilytica DSM 15894]|uniref:Glycoside hydrolase clan GH-D n=1 Tax=Xylanimonas cellulosilytica (strain DSM 15894 / JCM 12276 / CECT 5975 / KCTC 9989 / LMG 20990 / NBRC 107835 / XIL07) TaxID=446471 RepID=D1BZ26_XYLCX|nr:glycoside hydrolase family 36 protein [Xylanimonas cellulosilytica]ACZ31923.1 glycoside hydrolase clan GH-D [Xylanimonas cellulosilytica DSM 15894]